MQNAIQRRSHLALLYQLLIMQRENPLSLLASLNLPICSHVKMGVGPLMDLTCVGGFCRTPGDEVYPGKDEYGAE